MRFLGMVGYYRSFCPNFSFVENEWSLSCQQAFGNFKRLLCRTPVLATQRFGSPFQIQVDASQVGAGAVLLHTTENGVDHSVSYFSSKFNSHQEYYSTIENETLALIWALQHFNVYVTSGTNPIVCFFLFFFLLFFLSDHNHIPLTFFHSLQSPPQRLV